MNTDRSQYEALGKTQYDKLVRRIDVFIGQAWPGTDIDPKVRVYRALEELMELAQVLEVTPEKVHELVDYVYGRPVGELNQELGGVAFTTTALFSSLDKHFVTAGYEAVQEAEGRIDQIREKSKKKPHVV